MAALQAFFLPVGDGQRFCLFHPAHIEPQALPRGQVVYIHPFAEEMNKSRRMAAMQSRALAQTGFDVLQMDLLGCGDSSGDFGDATWAVWIQDVVNACAWLRARLPATSTLSPPLWLWGLRAGCLLATQAAQAAQVLNEPVNFLFWAPTPSGKLLLQQFLRLKAAADMASGNAKAAMENLRTDIAQGRSVEIAGYRLAPALAAGLEQATLAPPASGFAPGRVEWFELSTREDAPLPPAASQTLDLWQSAGYAVHSHCVRGPSFWQTTEIEDAPALLDASSTVLMHPDATK